MTYIGVSPSNGVRRVHTYTATGSQTSFTGASSEGITLSYTDANFVDVYQNGVLLAPADYTATSGTSIVLGEGAAASDIVTITVYDAFSVADTVSKSAGGTFDGNVAMAGTLGVTGVLTGTSLDISGDIDIDGTTNLDTTNVVGAFTVTGDVTLNDGSPNLRLNDTDTNRFIDILYGTRVAQFRNTMASGEDMDTVEPSMVFSFQDDGETRTAITIDHDANTIFSGDIRKSTAGTSNFAAGVNAGNSIASGGNYNTVVGDEAGTAITTGDNNTAIGFESLSNNTTGESNVALGRRALDANTTGSNNTATGFNSNVFNTTGVNNSAYGSNALQNNTSGGQNVAVGRQSLLANTTASGNTAVGYQSLYANTTALYNTAVGYKCLISNVTGEGNTGIGWQSLFDNTGSNNVGIGMQALQTNSSGSSNVAVGREALLLNTTGTSNVAVGTSALDANTTGANNIGIGTGSLGGNTTASNNTAVGYGASQLNTTGGSNTVFGREAGYANQTGEHNTFVGRSSGIAVTSSSNTFIGRSSGSQITSGESNSIVGRYNGNQYGLDIRTLSNRIILSDGDGNPRFYINNTGYTNASPDISDSTRTMSGVTSHVLHQDLGDITAFIENSNSNPYGAYFHFSGGAPNNNSNYFLLCADTSATRLVIKSDGDVQNTNNSYSALSDQKLKEQITDASSQWDDIKALTVRKYKMKEEVSAKGDSDDLWRLGVVAQELETAGMKGLVKDNPDRDENNKDLGTKTKSVKYSILHMKAIKALQEAMARIETLEAEVKALKGE